MTTQKEESVAMAPANVTLITSGFRTRVRTDSKRKYASIQAKDKYSTQEELQDLWEKRVLAVPQDDYVDAAADFGIFSHQFGLQTQQIATPDNTYAISMGLGLVNLGNQYPQYDLGEHEVDLPGLLKERGNFNSKSWWAFLCSLTSTTLRSVITDAIGNGNRVIVAIPPAMYYMLREEFDALLQSTKVTLDDIIRYLRLVGPDIETVVPAKLLPCVMPYDRDSLNVIVPGARSNGTRRAAFLLNHVAAPKETGNDPRKDYSAMETAFTMGVDGHFEPLKYEASTVTAGEGGTKLRKLSDEEAIAMIKRDYLTKTPPIPLRISRMMRDDGLSMSQERAEELLNKIAKDKADKAADKGSGSGGSGKKASAGSEKKDKPKSKPADKEKKRAAEDQATA